MRPRFSVDMAHQIHPLNTVEFVVAECQSQSSNFLSLAEPIAKTMRCFQRIRASINELAKVMNTDEMAICEAVWGEMHIEYDVFKTTMDITPHLKGCPTTVILARIGVLS